MMWSLGVLLFCGWLSLLTQADVDVNECADTTVCPAYASCTNTVGSYHCTCKRGFHSSNGLTQFSGPGVECKDVDECSASPSPCGPNSVCKNLPGRYKCSCLHGYSAPTGDDWVPGKPGHFSCTDIDECLSGGLCGERSQCANTWGSYSCRCLDGFTSNNSTCEDVNECADTTVCPAYASCTNTVGSYHCTCKRGFHSSNGLTQFSGPGVECKDVDECSASPSPCGPNSVCKNLPGRYKCSCLHGYSAPTGDDWVPGKPGHFSCTDIDECLSGGLCGERSQCANTWGSYSCRCLDGFTSNNSTCEDMDECAEPGVFCPEHSTCHNSLGSYYCVCDPGFESSTGNMNFHGSGGTCEGVPFKCKEDVIPNNEQVLLCQAEAAMGTEYAPFCTLINTTFGIVDKVCENKTASISLKSMAESFSSVFEQTPMWSNLTKDEASTLATVLLESVRSTMLAALLKPSANGSQTIQTEHLEIEGKVIKDECTDKNMAFNLKAKGDEMKISCSAIEESESRGTTGVALVSFVGLESVLDERFFQDPLANSSRRLKVNSRIIGGLMTGEKKDGFSDPVIYTLENIEPKQKSERPICVSWSTDVKGGRWTRSGCVVLAATEMHTVCSCHQMANLAILMASGELTMEFSLFIISHVGMIISLVCLALAIATFLLCRVIRNHNTYLHLHLCVCLFLAKLLFLTGVDKTDNQVGCAVIAGSLHFLFLACFFWMLEEAVMLFLMVKNLKVVNYFSSRNIKMLYLCAFGYGLPGLVVVISASVQLQGYGMHNRCWLNTETGFIWSFLGPVCTIIMINSILLTWTLWILRQKLSSVNTKVSTLKDTRMLTFKAFAHLFILGCSWVLGIFQIGPVASVMAYLFTVVNSLQGAFIFLIHCLLNRQVREEYWKCVTRKTKPSSQSQTAALTLSSVPSTSKMG